MKKHIIILLITFLCLPKYLEAQLKYYDAAEFPLYGKASENTENRYERLPESLKKWENLNNNLMNHMTPTDTKGLDLESIKNNTYKYKRHI